MRCCTTCFHCCPRLLSYFSCQFYLFLFFPNPPPSMSFPQTVGQMRPRYRARCSAELCAVVGKVGGSCGSGSSGGGEAVNDSAAEFCRAQWLCQWNPELRKGSLCRFLECRRGLGRQEKVSWRLDMWRGKFLGGRLGRALQMQLEQQLERTDLHLPADAIRIRTNVSLLAETGV